jgi:predicted nuclease of predicted toxin-antitoxin system
MRFLADAGVSPDTVAFLTRLGHDAIHVRAVEMHRAQDQELVDYARSEGRVVVTFDLDFGDILALGVLDRPSVILFRLSDERPAEVNGRLGAVVAEQAGALESGALIVVEDARYRVRKLPIAPG